MPYLDTERRFWENFEFPVSYFKLLRDKLEEGHSSIWKQRSFKQATLYYFLNQASVPF